MPLPLTVSCFSKIRIVFTFLLPAHQGSPGQRVVKRVLFCISCTLFLIRIIFKKTVLFIIVPQIQTQVISLSSGRLVTSLTRFFDHTFPQFLVNSWHFRGFPCTWSPASTINYPSSHHKKQGLAVFTNNRNNTIKLESNDEMMVKWHQNISTAIMQWIT